MKVVMVCTSDIQGGAARATNRLHQALIREGIDSQLIVRFRFSKDSSVVQVGWRFSSFLGKLRRFLDKLPTRLYRHRSKTLFSPAWLPFSNVVDQINELKPDVVHLHWLAGGLLSINDLSKIKAPVVWTLHDMWPFTGGCHYDEECGAFVDQCGNCVVLRSKTNDDLSHKVWKRKAAVYSQMENLTVVGVSRWISEQALRSSLLGKSSVTTLPNALDTTAYSPISKKIARQKFNLPLDKKLIAFGAIDALNDPRKGYQELCSALSAINTKDVELVIFGSDRPDSPHPFKQKVTFLGHLEDDYSLCCLYSAADVMLVPSKQESFGQTASEAMACGTPVVAFGHSGLIDIVDHLSTGYLAEPFDPADLAKGIDWVLGQDGALSSSARQKVVSNFDSRIVALRHIDLYEKILGS